LENLRILLNVIEKSFVNWRGLPLVKISTLIYDTPCISKMANPIFGNSQNIFFLEKKKVY
jgi:hypothetical protein